MPPENPSDDLDADVVRADLATAQTRWAAVDVVASTGSTNADLAARARAGDALDAVLISDHQAAGRGRLGRTWTAPPGTSIALSVAIAPAADPRRWSWLPLLAGLAVADALRQEATLPAVLKWPNDVLVEVHGGGGKLAGLLAERIETPSGPACVIGVGLNVSLRADQLPVPTASSVALATAALGVLGPLPTRNALVAAVLVSLDRVLARWEAVPDDRSTAVAYAESCATLGRRVRVELADGSTVEGTAERVDERGHLVLATEDGPRTFGAGDVVHLR